MNKHPWGGDEWFMFCGVIVFLMFAVAIVTGW